MRNIRKMQQSIANSGYVKRLFYDKRSAKMLPHHSRYLRCCNFKMTFDKKKLLEKLPFLILFQILLFHKVLCFGNC